MALVRLSMDWYGEICKSEEEFSFHCAKCVGPVTEEVNDYKNFHISLQSGDTEEKQTDEVEVLRKDKRVVRGNYFISKYLQKKHISFTIKIVQVKKINILKKVFRIHGPVCVVLKYCGM